MSPLNSQTKLFTGLAVTFVACLLLGDVIGGKTFATFVGPISVGSFRFRSPSF